ncbi:hypothetical protein DH2020_044697 [Rehmannia glutinosa]|uniref:DUF642 domain-containing protein n=1 Tax=Rehmannia glutinosa TaxID=99300 RepID=A0ABR0UGV9_REHGL
MAVKVSILLCLCFLYTVSALAPPAPFEGLLPNGNFEEKPNPTGLKKTVLQGKHALPKWEINGFVEYISGGPQPGGMYFAVAHGIHAVRLERGLDIPNNPCEEWLTICTHIWGIKNINGGDTYAWGFRANSNYVKVIFHNPGMQEDPACGPLLDAVAIKELFPPLPTRVNLVKNNGFEEGPHLLINSSHGVLLPPKQEDLTSHSRLDNRIPKSQRLPWIHDDQAFAAKETMKAPFKSEGKGKFKSYSFKFTAVSFRTRLTFFSSFYHTRIDDFGSLCGPVLDEVRVFPAAKI